MQGTVTFDLWHTLLYLLPEEEEHYMQGQVAAATHVLEESPTWTGPVRTTEALEAAFREAYGYAVDLSRREGRTLTPAAQLARAAARVGRAPRPGEYERALERLVTGLDFRVAPGAVEALSALRQRGLTVGVISNTVGEPGRLLEPVCDRFGLARCVQRFIWSDELPWTKPNPAIFREALRRLDGSPQRAVHVGDTVADIRGARAAGFRGEILFTGLPAYGASYRQLFVAGDPSSDVQASREASNLREVVPLVEEFLGG